MRTAYKQQFNVYRVMYGVEIRKSEMSDGWLMSVTPCGARAVTEEMQIL